MQGAKRRGDLVAFDLRQQAFGAADLRGDVLQPHALGPPGNTQLRAQRLELRCRHRFLSTPPLSPHLGGDRRGPSHWQANRGPDEGRASLAIFLLVKSLD